jgi:hypothetical protein
LRGADLFLDLTENLAQGGQFATSPNEPWHDRLQDSLARYLHDGYYRSWK